MEVMKVGFRLSQDWSDNTVHAKLGLFLIEKVMEKLKENQNFWISSSYLNCLERLLDIIEINLWGFKKRAEFKPLKTQHMELWL